MVDEDEDDLVKIEVDLGAATHFVQFSEILHLLYIESGVTSQDDVGVYEIRVVLDDSKD